jgi:O-antigen ligase
MIAAIKNRWLDASALTVLMGTVAAWAYTGRWYYLLAPFAFLFLILMLLNWKTAYWILLFTIPFSIQINFAGDTASITLPDQPIMWLFLGVFALVWAKDPKRTPEWFWRDNLTLIIVLQFAWTAVAVIFSKMLFFSVKFLLAKTWLLVCFYFIPVWIFSEKKDFVRAFFLLLVPMLATILVILMHHAMLGFKFNMVQKSMTGLYYNHVDYSTVISMFIPLLLISWPLTKGRSPLLRISLAFIIIIFLVATYFAYARAAELGLVFAIVVALAIRFRLVNVIMPVFYGLLVMLVCYMVPNNKYLDYRPDYNNTYMHKTFADHILSTLKGRDMSSMERVYRWIAAVRMSTDRPITGYGPRAFYYYYKPYAVTPFRTYVSRNPEQSTTHNYFLYMLVEQGWPAMILYAILIYAIFAKAQRIYHRFKDKFYRLVTLGLAMTLAVGFINNFFSELIETHKVAALFFIPLALLAILDHKSKSPTPEGELA